MFVFDKMPDPILGLGGLEPGLSTEEKAVQGAAHQFAREVMRPIGVALDKMTPEEVIAHSSPIWSYLKQIKDSGLLDLKALAAMSAQEKARMMPLIFEELGWGDSGLTIAAIALSFPAFAAGMSGNPELIEEFGSSLGCWVGTQPDRGSDAVDWDATEVHPGARQPRGNLNAKVVGDQVVVNGQSAAWVSAGPLAQSAFVCCQCDYGDGLWDAQGRPNLINVLVPFDHRVTKGKPLNKLGQRALPQGEIFFNEVVLSKKYIMNGRDTAAGGLFGIVTFANMDMAMTFTGVARAAFEHALAYVHERKQGGVALINHQSVRARIFNMWRKVETARALTRRVVDFNFGSNGPHLLASITGKTFVTQTAVEVANEALQLFGGNGLAKDYPLEKLLRDATASLIEDGENNLLSLKGATWLSKWYQHHS
jgi:acyl-CoA dehydrogenase